MKTHSTHVKWAYKHIVRMLNERENTQYTCWMSVQTHITEVEWAYKHTVHRFIQTHSTLVEWAYKHTVHRLNEHTNTKYTGWMSIQTHSRQVEWAYKHTELYMCIIVYDKVVKQEEKN